MVIFRQLPKAPAAGPVLASDTRENGQQFRLNPRPEAACVYGRLCSS
jgi:hypothetical protein